MDLTEMMDYLVIDLKMSLDTEISTAEATRCIVRAVDDMSRTLPRERIYEHTWVEAVTDDSFTTPVTASDTSLVNGISISAATDGDMATLVTYWLDVPRPCEVTITDGDTSITRLTLIIKGTDADGVYREERFYRHGGLEQTGKVYFSSIKEIEINEISGNGAGDVLSVGYASAYDIWVQLDNPIKPDSETIYSGAAKTGTKYVKDTDYRMDYANGRIKLISGGSISENTTYYANYDRAQTAIDISTIIPELIRITKVLYPADKVPEQSVAFSIWENMLTLGSPRPGVSQEAMVDKEHIAIFYEARHAPPTDVSSGSYPEHLNQVVLIGAAGYALLIEAIQYEQQAVTDLASARTALTSITGSGIHGLAIAALAKAAVLLTASSGKIDLALTKVALYLETYDDGASGSPTDNARDVLANITDEASTLRTRIDALLSKSNDYLFGDTEPSALKYLDTGDAIVSAIDATTYLTGTSGVAAKFYLDTGDGLINQLNDGGADVPTKYADYARAAAQISQGLRGQAETYAGYASACIALFNGLVTEAQTRIANIASIIQESDAWRAIGETFIAEAQTLIGQVNACATEAATHISRLDRYIAEAAQHQETANIDMLLSDRFRAEAQIRLIEFHDILKSKAEYRKRVVSVPVRQPG